VTDDPPLPSLCHAPGEWLASRRELLDELPRLGADGCPGRMIPARVDGIVPPFLAH
jgi:hypothetical protein